MSLRWVNGVLIVAVGKPTLDGKDTAILRDIVQLAITTQHFRDNIEINKFTSLLTDVLGMFLPSSETESAKAAA